MGLVPLDLSVLKTSIRLYPAYSGVGVDSGYVFEKVYALIVLHHCFQNRIPSNHYDSHETYSFCGLY